MKKLLFILATVATALSMGAATISIGNSSVITQSGAYHPVMSAGGDKVLFSTGDYHGLWLTHIDTGETQQISDATSSGFAPRFTASCESVIYRTESRVDHLRMKNVMSYNVAGSESIELAPMSRASVDLAAYATPAETLARSDYREILVTIGGVESRISPIENTYSYLWVSLSPDGQRILFVEAHSGMHICNLDGTGLTSLGRGAYPSWISNDFVVFTRSDHDGEQITSSQIMAIDVTTLELTEITPADAMAEEASGCLKAGKLIYSDINGQMTAVEISVSDSSRKEAEL